MVKFDYKVKCGADYVALRTISNGVNLDSGSGIILSEDALSNSKLGHYIVEDIGEVAEAETDVHVGDYVKADRLAIFYKSEPVGIMRYDSIIVKTDKTGSVYHPIRNTCLVVQDRTEVQKLDGIYLQNRADILNIGTMIEANPYPDEKFPFKPGDKIFMSKCADFIRAGTTNYYIYKCGDILCKILE